MLELLLILCLILIYCYQSFEHFDYSIPYLNGDTNFPWNNMTVGTKNNMSYDIRGDPLVIPHKMVSPWDNPETYPIYNPPLSSI